MSVERTHVYCNECKVVNAPAVLDVLCQYDSSIDFEVVPAPSGPKSSACVLKPLIEDEDLIDWPRAIEFDVLMEEYEDVLPEAYVNGEELSDNDWETYFNVLDEAREKHGDDGFLGMLSSLAPHLSTPLTIHAITFDKAGREPVSACEWHVRPGDATVEVNRFLHSQPMLAVPG